MTDSTSKEFLNELSKLEESKEERFFPLNGFKRLTKEHTKEKNISSTFPILLRELATDFCIELIKITEQICDVAKRKTLTEDMLRKAFEIKKQFDKKN